MRMVLTGWLLTTCCVVVYRGGGIARSIRLFWQREELYIYIELNKEVGQGQEPLLKEK
jgi:hypothetical protein